MSHGDTKRTALRTFIEGALLGIDYQTAIGLGNLTGHVPFRAMGRRTSLATTVGGDDLWEGTAVTVSFPDQTNGEQLTLVSTSANDASAGTGAQQVDVHGIRKGGTEYTETVTMNGTTPVNTTITDWIFVQYLHTQRVSALGAVSAGDISIYRTGDATAVLQLSMPRIFPAGTIIKGTAVSTSAGGTASLSYGGWVE